MTRLDEALKGSQKKVVVIAPHPDDEVIGVGGVIRLLLSGGSKVKVVVVTTGSRGSQKAMKDPAFRPELAAVRADEERDCAALLGYSSVPFGLEAAHPVYAVSEKIRKEIEGADIIFTPHLDDGHPTHVAVTRALMDAEPTAEVWGYETWRPINSPTLLVDISKVMDIKVKAIELHRSQVSQRDFPGAAKGLARYRGVFSKIYPDLGYEYAEAFALISSPQ